MVLRVVLGAQGGEKLTHTPGRDLLISTDHTFAQLAAAIDRAFARWDVSHLHEFQLPGGRRIVSADDDENEEGDLDEAVETLGSIGIALGGSFAYTFDLGAGWEHRCTVVRDGLDPVAEAGIMPREILPIFGWGSIPDQYGRLAPDAEGDNGS